MTDSLDTQYVAARRTLLDVLVALTPHASALIVVGAHAVYAQTGDAGIKLAPFTTDADLAVNPELLGERPELDRLLAEAGFRRELDKPGSWFATTAEGKPIPIDLMVPAAVAPGAGRRSVPLRGHDKMATRRAVGLEPALIDNDLMLLTALDPADTRTVTVRVAGPTALLIAKAHKLHDRDNEPTARRLSQKDAADVFRLMRTVEARVFTAMVTLLLADERTQEATGAGLAYLDELFGAPARPGVRMAVDALETAVPANQVEAVVAAFIRTALTPVCR
jgi:hypothetical protein